MLFVIANKFFVKMVLLLHQQKIFHHLQFVCTVAVTKFLLIQQMILYSAVTCQIVLCQLIEPAWLHYQTPCTLSIT